MRILLIFISICFATLCYNQERLKGYVGLSQNSDYNFITTESNLNLGIDYDFIGASLSIYGTYAYGGAIGYTNFSSLHKDFSPFQLDFHLLGAGIKLRIRDKDKLYSPTFKLKMLSEIYSKYKGGRIISPTPFDQDVYFSPTNHVYNVYETNYGEPGPPVEIVKHLSYNYLSTPFVGSFFIGNEFKVLENLYLNIGIGYLLRTFRYYIIEWDPDEVEPNIQTPQTPALKESIGYFEFEFGVNYFFSFKK